MRNPFSHLAKRDTARPSLRERATSLKASAARVIRRKAVDAAPAAPDISPAADPVLAAIAEARNLMAARNRAALLPQPAGSIDPLPEQDAAAVLFNTHVDTVLLTTVPTTAAGCAALARYAGEFLEENDFALDEDLNNEQHVRILNLIARSPMLDSLPTGRPPVPDFSGLSDEALVRTYAACKVAFDVAGLSTWTLHDEAGGSRLLNDELDRLGVLQGDIADELVRRGPPVGMSVARRYDTLIDRAIMVGHYDEAAHFASEAAGKWLLRGP